MPHDAAWLDEQARLLAQKRQLLASLEDKLAAWQAQISLDALPAAKRSALETLTRESIATLQDMIARVSAELPVEPQRNGRHAPPGQPRG